MKIKSSLSSWSRDGEDDKILNALIPVNETNADIILMESSIVKRRKFLSEWYLKWIFFTNGAVMPFFQKNRNRTRNWDIDFKSYWKKTDMLLIQWKPFLCHSIKLSSCAVCLTLRNNIMLWWIVINDRMNYWICTIFRSKACMCYCFFRIPCWRKACNISTVQRVKSEPAFQKLVWRISWMMHGSRWTEPIQSSLKEEGRRDLDKLTV